jgi:hypothetical protein
VSHHRTIRTHGASPQFHHGHENSGTRHKCALNGTRGDDYRECKCNCATTADFYDPSLHD